VESVEFGNMLAHCGVDMASLKCEATSNRCWFLQRISHAKFYMEV